MQCGQCQADNREGRRFCAECGAPLSAPCIECGFENEPEENFCGGCGRPTNRQPADTVEKTPASKPPPQGERRPVTVLFADIVGFTGLSSRLDAEEIHRLLGRFFDTVDGLVAQFGGKIDKHIGDNVMAVFGAPIAHGDDPARAVRTALAIHDAMPALSAELGDRIEVHIGIASGQVVASHTGSRHHTEYTVTGDSVNLASRLDGMAGAGETLIANGVYRAVETLVNAEDIGETMVKGLAKPVRVWRLRGLADGEGDRSRLPFVGRQGMQAQFDGMLTGCLRANAGQAILLRGEAGIGKTRLVEEFSVAAGGKGFAVFRSLNLDFGVGKGRDAIAMLVRELLEAVGESKTDLAAGIDGGGLFEHSDRVFLNDLLGLPQPEELRAEYEAMNAEAREAGKRNVVRAVVRAASARGPLLLVAEDVHWAGAGTLHYLSDIAAAIQDRAAILVMTTRIEGDPIDRSWRAAARTPLTTLDLEPLRHEEALLLASAMFDSTNRFARNCVERANGNPLFLEQLLRNAAESEDENIPDSIQSLVMARLDRLEPEDKRALQAASVLGQRFGLEALRGVLNNPSYDCVALQKHALLRPEGKDYLFAHALIREGVEASLLRATRSEMHRKAASWFQNRDAVLFAEHLDRAGDPQAARAYCEAARAEAAEYRFEQALALAGRGLELATSDVERHALICRRGDYLRELGMVEESIAAFQEAAEKSMDGPGKSEAFLGLAMGMRLTDRIEEALTLLDDAEAEVGDRISDLEQARIHHLRANLCFPLGRMDDCRTQHELALDFARRAGNIEMEASALGGLGDAAYGIGRMRSANNYFQRCVEMCREHGLGRVQVANQHMVGWSRIHLNELELALKNSVETAETAAKLGQIRAEIMGTGCAAFALINLGRHDEAALYLDRSLELSRRLGAKRFEAQNLSFRAEILMAEGRHAEALPLTRQAVSLARESGLGFVGPKTLGCLARATDDPNERRAAIEEALFLLRAGTVGHNFIWFYREAMEGAIEHGEWGEARRFASAMKEFTRAEPLPWSEFFADRALALADFGEHKRSDGLTTELTRLREIAESVGFRTALQAIEEALMQQ